MTKEELDELELAKRTLIKVVWEDITDDTTGDPDMARLSERTTYALFWRFIEDTNMDTPCVVLTYTDDPDLSAQQGWLCIPLACVSEVEVIRRPRANRHTSRKPKADPRAEADGSAGRGGNAPVG